jgi:mannosyl-3-phosphoglycerate phosphatase
MWSSWWMPATGDTSPWAVLTHAWRQHVSKRSRDAGGQIVVFADLDGTLPGLRAHPCLPDCEALKLLAEHGVPIVLCSSRTRVELELVQQEFEFRHPFISESGAAVYIPRGYFSSSDPVEFGGYDVLAFGGPHQQVVEALRRTAEALGIEVRHFNGMSVQEVADECGLSLADARLTQLREYGEPFRILASDPAVHRRLISALRRAGLRCVSGGAFHHVLSGADVRFSVRALTSLYRQRFGKVLTIGVSSGRIEPSLLSAVDIPIVALHPQVDAAHVLRKLLLARVTDRAGSSGWDEAMLSVTDPAPPHVNGPR